MTRPVAYLRRSSATRTSRSGRGRREGHVSHEVQTAAVHALARQHGHELRADDVLEDWGVSGRRERTQQRRAYLVLRERIRAGQVSALYAYSLSRLARSTRELLDLAEACDAASVPIRLAKEGEPDIATSHGRMYLTVLAAVATFESEVASERAVDRTAALRDRGAFVGRPPYGWRHGDDGQLVRYEPEASVDDEVRQLYAATPNAREVARTLNERGVASPTGVLWRDGTVRRIIARGGGALTPGARDRTVRGSRALHVAAFARLLVCAECGHRLTTNRNRYVTAAGEARRWTGYTCQGARLMPSHTRPAAISEAAVLRWAMPEVARLAIPIGEVAMAEVAALERARLAARREAVVDMVEAGTITRTEAEPRLARIVSEVAELDEREAIRSIPTVDWAWPPATLGPVLAAIFQRITVDLRAGQLTADWAVPEWRAA